MTSESADETADTATGPTPPAPELASPPRPTRTLKLTLEYNGTAYQGWQLQPGVATIQGELELRLQRILGSAHRVHGSGRTDAGVHARGQVAHFYTVHPMPLTELKRALNATLPRDIAVSALEEAAPDFHARYTPHLKRYAYQFWTRPERSPFLEPFSWHLLRGLEPELMARAGQVLVGTHDFSAFRAADCGAKTAVRTITALRVQELQPQLYVLQVEGPGFLKHMVRNIVGSLVEVGQGRRPEAWIQELLLGRDRARAARTAPARGLWLEWVQYLPPGSTAEGTPPALQAASNPAVSNPALDDPEEVSA